MRRAGRRFPGPGAADSAGGGGRARARSCPGLGLRFGPWVGPSCHWGGRVSSRQRGASLPALCAGSPRAPSPVHLARGLPPAPGVPSFSGVPAMGKMPGRVGPDLCLLCFPAFVLSTGDCGPLPKLNYAIPSDMDRIEGFPVDTQVTYKCRDGFFKIPGKSDTVVCLSNSQWSSMNEFCGRSCDVPTRLKFAALSKEDEMRNYYPAGINVRYTCRPGYENITEMLLVSTCLDNLTWSEAPEFCRRKSCGHPGEVLHGRAVHKTEFLYGAKIDFLCEDGYNNTQTFIVMTFSFPTAITCSSPPYIANGTYDGRSVKNFAYNSTVTYRCDRGFQLIGAASIHCTTKDKTSGIWSGPAPKCKDVIFFDIFQSSSRVSLYPQKRTGVLVDKLSGLQPTSSVASDALILHPVKWAVAHESLCSNKFVSVIVPIKTEQRLKIPTLVHFILFRFL
uniref:Sushi domain-containing protein n=1 Tax=Chelonoidis abingdonii TaxID=106734 RepID=A0A8C0IM62_CHEAB